MLHPYMEKAMMLFPAETHWRRGRRMGCFQSGNQENMKLVIGHRIKSNDLAPRSLQWVD
jgi:hypothetical protein